MTPKAISISSRSIYLSIDKLFLLHMDLVFKKIGPQQKKKKGYLPPEARSDSTPYVPSSHHGEKNSNSPRGRYDATVDAKRSALRSTYIHPLSSKQNNKSTRFKKMQELGITGSRDETRNKGFILERKKTWCLPVSKLSGKVGTGAHSSVFLVVF